MAKRARIKILYYAGWSLTRIISTLIFRIKTYGQEHFPETGGCIVATNHISYFDPLMVGSWAPRQMYFLAKRELFKNKIFGNVIHRTNALPISRGTVDREALRQSMEVIKDGFPLLVFPEGTRSKTGEFLEPKLGIGMMARRAECPIVPGYIQGSNRLKDCFWGRIRMMIVYGEPIPAEWVRAQPADKDGYMAIGREVMRRITALREEAQKVK